MRTGPLMLVGGMILLFACSRLLPGIFARNNRSFGGRAVAHFLPIAAASITAMLLGFPGIALAIVFGTSVGAMTTAVGFVAMAEPVGPGPQRWRRIWAFALVAALIVFIAGFKGDFRWRDALALGIEGAVVVMLWREDKSFQPVVVSNLDSAIFSGGERISSALSAPPDDGDESYDDPMILTGELVLAVAVAFLGAWLAIEGVTRTAGALQGPVRSSMRASATGLAASLLSLSLVLPMTYGAWRRAANGRAWEPMTTQVAILMLNLCLLLPILILFPYVVAWFPNGANFAKGAYAWSEGIPRLLLFPIPNWRIDNVILIVVGILLLPVSFGKWSLGREEGLILIAGYFFYLTAILALG